MILYRELLNIEYFVDKSDFIKKISKRIWTNTKYVCVTKPRRFGKTSMLNMLGAYYCKAYDSAVLFDSLNISKAENYRTHLNRYNVIHLCLNNLSDNGNTYDDYISLIKNSIRHDILESYPALKEEEIKSVSEMLTATEDELIFIINEWDYIFSHELYPEHYSDLQQKTFCGLCPHPASRIRLDIFCNTANADGIRYDWNVFCKVWHSVLLPRVLGGCP